MNDTYLISVDQESRQRLLELEQVIRQGLETFIEVGQALAEIKQKHLYKQKDYTRFDDYCREQWGFTSNYIKRQIRASQVIANITKCVPMGTQDVNNTPLPQTERQARPLSTLEPEQQREAWQEVVRQNPNGNITSKKVKQVVKDFNYKRDTKRPDSQDTNKPHWRDAMQTPPEALDCLMPYIPQYIEVVWEPAAGEGYLVQGLSDRKFNVISSDLITGQNFFDWQPEEYYECIITNPPYSVKYQWLERCYQLRKPFALLMPVEMIAAKRAKALFEKYGDFGVIFPDGRINFKMPNKGWDSNAQFPTAWFTWQFTIESNHKIAFTISK